MEKITGNNPLQKIYRDYLVKWNHVEKYIIKRIFPHKFYVYFHRAHENKQLLYKKTCHRKKFYNPTTKTIIKLLIKTKYIAKQIHITIGEFA
jgi:hypothetical protein